MIYSVGCRNAMRLYRPSNHVAKGDFYVLFSFNNGRFCSVHKTQYALHDYFGVINDDQVQSRLFESRQTLKVVKGLILLKNSKVRKSDFFAIGVRYRKPPMNLLVLAYKSIRVVMFAN